MAEVQKLVAATADFLQKLGEELRMPQMTIATAIMFFHRYFQKHSLSVCDHKLVAQACLFLAGKAEDTPKKLRDVILEAHKLWQSASGGELSELKEDSEDFRRTKEMVLKAERDLLHTSRFDLNVVHSYKFIMQYVKQIKGERDLAQVAWSFYNDSLRTQLCLRFNSERIAIGVICLAAKFLKPKYDEVVDLKANKEIWGNEITEAECTEIANTVLDLYEDIATWNGAGAKDGDRPAQKRARAE